MVLKFTHGVFPIVQSSMIKKHIVVTLVLSLGALVTGVGGGLWAMYAHEADLAPWLGIKPGPARASEVDIGFAQSMNVHHDQAVTMAQIVGTRGSPMVNAIALGILYAQLQEIGEIKGWLNAQGAPVLPTDAVMSWLEKGTNRDAPVDALYLQQCKTTPGGMPGLATYEELNQLRSAQGKTLDAMFLKFMIRHHEGAIPMAQFAANNGHSDYIKGMARHIVRDQTKEIAVMQGLLKQST